MMVFNDMHLEANLSVTVSGPVWIAEIDSLAYGAVIGGAFETKAEMIAFINKHPGNRSETFLPSGKEMEYIVFHSVARMNEVYDKYAEQLKEWGTSE